MLRTSWTHQHLQVWIFITISRFYKEWYEKQHNCQLPVGKKKPLWITEDSSHLMCRISSQKFSLHLASCSIVYDLLWLWQMLMSRQNKESALEWTVNERKASLIRWIQAHFALADKRIDVWEHGGILFYGLWCENISWFEWCIRTSFLSTFLQHNNASCHKALLLSGFSWMKVKFLD